MKNVILYTDGACSYNPGPGGWAAILIFKGVEKELSGFVKETTNNRMELFAVIQGLRALKEPCNVSVHTDSAYVSNAFLKNWILGWVKNGWKTSKKDPVENQDLWKLLLHYTKIHNVTWVKVEGHSDDKLNNRCDKLAKDQIKNAKN